MTDHYAESRPSTGGADMLACAWSRGTGGSGSVHRIVPDGCVDLIWSGDALFVAGPDTRAYLSPTAPGTLVGVRFRPGAATALLHLPAEAIRDVRPALADLLTDRDGRAFAARLANELAATDDAARAGRLLERAVLARLRRDLLDPVGPAVVAGLRSGATVGELASRLGLTERGLHRRCLAAFGYGPKMVQRVLRFQRALRLARSGMSFADTAVEAGYADQPHFAREVRALAGVPLTVLVGPRE